MDWLRLIIGMFSSSESPIKEKSQNVEDLLPELPHAPNERASKWDQTIRDITIMRELAIKHGCTLILDPEEDMTHGLTIKNTPHIVILESPEGMPDLSKNVVIAITAKPDTIMYDQAKVKASYMINYLIEKNMSASIIFKTPEELPSGMVPKGRMMLDEFDMKRENFANIGERVTQGVVEVTEVS